MSDSKKSYDINAMQIIGMLLKRWWMISIAAVLCAVFAFGYTHFFVTPMYRAEATLIINGGSSLSTTYQEILAGQYQSKDYPYILNANLTLDMVAQKLNEYDFDENGGKPYRYYTADVLAKMISNEAVDESRIFKISVRSPYAEESRIIANTVVEVFPKRVESLIRGGSVGVVDLAITPARPASSSYSRNMLIGFAVGLVAGVAAAIALGIFSDTLEDEKWLMQAYGEEIPLLAVIPNSGCKRKKSYRYGYGSRRNYDYYSK